MIDKMKFLRKAQGITQVELAAKCETTQQQIAKIETGLVDPKLSTVNKVADALGCEIQDLFFTRSEFLKLIQKAIEDGQIETPEMKLIDLNSRLAKEHHFPPFHRFWEEVKINKNKVYF